MYWHVGSELCNEKTPSTTVLEDNNDDLIFYQKII